MPGLITPSIPFPQEIHCSYLLLSCSRLQCSLAAGSVSEQLLPSHRPSESAYIVIHGDALMEYIFYCNRQTFCPSLSVFPADFYRRVIPRHTHAQELNRGRQRTRIRPPCTAVPNEPVLFRAIASARVNLRHRPRQGITPAKGSPSIDGCRRRCLSRLMPARFQEGRSLLLTWRSVYAGRAKNEPRWLYERTVSPPESVFCQVWQRPQKRCMGKCIMADFC